MDFSKLAEDLKKITYADTYNKPIQNKIIRTFEKVMVRSKLAKRFFELGEMIENGVEVDEAALQAFGLKVELKRGKIESIPKTGPVMIVGNHPFGIVDGMVVAAMVRGYRKDLKVIAHQGISQLPQFADFFLPINFDRSEEAKQINKASVDEFKDHLKQGGIGIMFPSGAVSTKRPIWKKNADPPWHPSVGKWSKDFNCTVVPVFIDGRCGTFFQLVSQFSMTLRLSALLYENSKKIDSEIGMRVGEPLDLNSLPEDWDAVRTVRHFRELCYGLADQDVNGKKLKKKKKKKTH